MDQDADHGTREQPDHLRACRLPVRLGSPHVAQRTSLFGDGPVTGLDTGGQEAHGPDVVLAAAAREGLLPTLVGLTKPPSATNDADPLPSQ